MLLVCGPLKLQALLSMLFTGLLGFIKFELSNLLVDIWYWALELVFLVFSRGCRRRLG